MEIMEIIFSINDKKKKYLFVGFINTVFGYLVGIFNFTLFYNLIGIFFLSLLNNILSITFSFLTYKYLVFKTENKFFVSEYLKSYLVYGLMFIMGTFLLWFTLEIMKFNIFIAQFITISLTVVLSYVGNNYFTFK